MSSDTTPQRVEKIIWTPELIEAFWNGVAKTRLDDLSFGKVAGPAFLDLIDPFLERAGQHLDFGAGSGHVVKLLLERGYSAAGFDPSPERQVKLAQAIGDHANFLGVEGSGPGRQYDSVLLMEVMEHILEQDFDATMRKVSNFVKPNGFLIVSTPNNEDIEQASVFCPVSGILFHPWQHVRSFTPAKLCETLENVGFRKEWMMLADFSNDVKLIEECKRFRDAQPRSILLSQRLSQSVEDFRKELRQQSENIAQVTQRASQANLAGFLARLLRMVGLRKERPDPALELQRLMDRMQASLQARADSAKALTADLRALEQVGEPKDSGVDHEGINRRLGRESTIVYVGRKM